MKREDIEKIEAQLNIKLPQSYIEAVMTNPFSDKLKYPNIYNRLKDDDEELIDINVGLRKEGYKKKKWPSNFYVIGCQGKDTYYFIDTNVSDSSNIYAIYDEERLNHNNVKRYLLSENYEEFIKDAIFLQNLSDEHDNPKGKVVEIDINEYFKKWDEAIKNKSGESL